LREAEAVVASLMNEFHQEGVTQSVKPDRNEWKEFFSDKEGIISETRKEERS
jgi:hypothetical protein